MPKLERPKRWKPLPTFSQGFCAQGLLDGQKPIYFQTLHRPWRKRTNLPCPRNLDGRGTSEVEAPFLD